MKKPKVTREMLAKCSSGFLDRLYKSKLEHVDRKAIIEILSARPNFK